MQIDLKHRNSFPLVQVLLGPGEAIVAESSTLVGISPAITVETKVRGGQIKSYMRSQAGTYAYYLNTYRAVDNNGEVLLAPRLLGEVYSYALGESRDRILINVESFLGAQESVMIETAWRGASSFQMSSGMQMLRCSGEGTLLISSFGAVHTIELAEGESYTVDHGHLVGYTDQVQMRVRQLGGVRSTLLRGQEIVFETDRDSGGSISNWELYKVNVANVEQPMLSRLTTDPANDHRAAWSNDGSRIAFLSDRGSEQYEYAILVMNPDGQMQQTLTAPGPFLGPITWSPDDHWLMATGYGDMGYSKLFRIGTGSGQLWQLTQESSLMIGWPVWRPDTWE